jgi:hypothetical protein
MKLVEIGREQWARPSRRELYDLVWSKPITKVAQELGISGAAVARHVQTPPRAYTAESILGQSWNRTKN